MDLDWKIKLIDDLIKENELATIRDYLDALKEIMQVEESTVIRLILNSNNQKAAI